DRSRAGLQALLCRGGRRTEEADRRRDGGCPEQGEWVSASCCHGGSPVEGGLSRQRDATSPVPRPASTSAGTFIGRECCPHGRRRRARRPLNPGRRALMRALCYHGKYDIRCDTVPDPEIEDPRDAIVKVSSCAICGSDLHLYDGFMPGMMHGDIMGHEFMGEVVEVGRGNAKLKVGDRVVVPFTIVC